MPKQKTAGESKEALSETSEKAEKVEKAESAKPEEIKGEKAIDKAIKSDAQMTKEALDKEPKIRFVIPLEEKEPKNATQYVAINGYEMYLQKGVPIDVPESVYLIVAESIRIDRAEDMLLSRSEDVMEKLS